MTAYEQTFLAFGQTLHSLNAGSALQPESGSSAEAARMRLRRRLARLRRREAVEPFLREPWTAWSGEGDAARIARRFLSRYPDRDLSFDDGLRTDRQAAAEYHRDEESLEAETVSEAIRR